jgi:hypothetical protein
MIGGWIMLFSGRRRTVFLVTQHNLLDFSELTVLEDRFGHHMIPKFETTRCMMISKTASDHNIIAVCSCGRFD